MFSSKNASDDDDGTVARGGQEWGFNGTLGREMRDFTIAGVFDADYDGRHDALNQASGDEVGTSSSWLYTLGLATQTRFSDQFSVNAGAGYAFGHDATVVNETTLIDHDSHVKGSPNLNAALNYHFIPNVLVGSIDYQHDFGGGSQSFYAIPADDSQIQNRAEDLLGVRLRYVFQ